MIFILFKKITATALACLITSISAAGYFENDYSVQNNSIMQVISAEAASAKVATPLVKLKSVYADRIYISISNLSKYKTGTVFNVYVNNTLAKKNVTMQTIADGNGYIALTHDGKINFKPSTDYTIKIKAVYNKTTSAASSALKVKTAEYTYFSFKAGTQFYQLKNSKMVKSTKISSSIVTSGAFANIDGYLISGRSASKFTRSYIKITQGKYKGKYVKISDNVATRISEDEYKRRVVSDYAASMDGGRYVYGGSSYRATDCSGLIMLSYAQIGISLPHSARALSSRGTSVSRTSMKAGDIIIMNGGSHVGMYIGNNKFVHAMNYSDGIKVQSTSYLKYYTVNSVRRII